MKSWRRGAMRSRQGWRWLVEPRGDPITWSVVRTKLRSTYAGRFAMLGGIVLLLGGIVLLLLLVLPWYVAEKEGEKGAVTYPHASLINPILGGLGALILIYAAIRQARTATEVARTGNRQAEIAVRRHVTDTFGKAVEQLGDDKMEVRVGGIYTLERLAREALDSERDADRDLYWTVMETLTAFVRERARWKEPKPAAEEETQPKPAPVFPLTSGAKLWGRLAEFVLPEMQPKPRPATDIAAVLDVIRRRPDAGLEREKQRHWRFDLSEGDLRGANLEKAQLEGASLSRVHFEGANLTDAHLDGASLHRTHLADAFLSGARLEGANLVAAHLDGAVLGWNGLAR